MDSNMPSIFKTELLMTMMNNIQQLAIVAKISARFLHQSMATKDDYYHSSLFGKF